jgi:hypothetical protein
VTAHPVQIIVLLDVDQAVDLDAVLAHVPDRRSDRHILRLTAFGYERPDGEAAPTRDRLDWPSLLEALHRLAERIERHRPADGTPPALYVAGFAPLSVFFALGTLLDTRTSHVTAINGRRDQAVQDVLPLIPSEGTFFRPPTNADPSAPQEASGRVALFVSVSTPNRETPREAIRAAVEQDGDRLAGTVAFLAGGPLDASNVGAALRQLTEHLTNVAAAWPARSGLTVFLAGPAPIALAAGLALNRNQFTGGGATIQLTEFVGGRYLPVGRLPFALRREPPIPDDPASQLARRKVFDAFKRGIASLKDRLAPEHVRVPAGFDTRPGERDTLAKLVLQKLRELPLGEEPEGDAFWLSTTQRRLTVGHGLLHGLVGLDGRILERLGQLFVLHELVHDPQHITSNDYLGIGRAGIVLEDIDFWADAFALSTVIEHLVARGGTVAAENCRELLVDAIDAHIGAMRAFDRMEQGDVLAVLPERRLRRYLIWYLQRARATTVRTPDDIRQLLDTRLFVEIAPLRGRLDARHDKITTQALPDAELFVALGGRLLRLQRGPGFIPADAVDAVRNFNEQTLHQLMDRAVTGGRALLAPWIDA